jgi:hypothetical protein
MRCKFKAVGGTDVLLMLWALEFASHALVTGIMGPVRLWVDMFNFFGNVHRAEYKLECLLITDLEVTKRQTTFMVAVPNF